MGEHTDYVGSACLYPPRSYARPSETRVSRAVVRAKQKPKIRLRYPDTSSRPELIYGPARHYGRESDQSAQSRRGV